MNDFASLERTMPPVVFEAPDGFSIRQLTEDLYIVTREEGVAAGLQELTDADLETMAERAAKRQLEIEEALNPATSMFFTEFE